ncbi:MAG TPA: hypothetical protein VNO31_40145 [Umezawaea sp.]|nr:hypothetical protein [Umezawaea sp.]
MEELLDFLLSRLDEAGFTGLVDHEPRRMYATFWLRDGGRSEERGTWFTGCATCSRIPSRVVVDPVTGAEHVLWRVLDMKAWREVAPPHEERLGPAPHKLEAWGSLLGLNIEEWPCRHVRLLTLPFADDPDFREWWRPQHAVFVSGKLVHQDGDREWPW